MDTATVVDLGRQALWMTVLISAPLLGVALFVGLAIGILQAATSINEATLSFIPKLAALAITLAVVGGWQLTTMVDYTRSLFDNFAGDFDLSKHNIFGAYSNVIVGIGSCILAYSGIESVLQTASLTKSWHETRKSYLFLAVTVGIITPIIAILILSGAKSFVTGHETDLVPAYATNIMGPLFGGIVSALASITLIMELSVELVKPMP